MKKINKANVKWLIENKGEATIIIIGHKENIHSPWVDLTEHTFKTIEEFERFLDSFLNYRCNSQTGYYPAYYIKTNK